MGKTIEELMTALFPLSIFPGVIVGGIIGYNFGRFIWPRGIRRACTILCRNIFRIKLKRSRKRSHTRKYLSQFYREKE